MRTRSLTCVVLVLAALAARALSTSFTYQGRLVQGGAAPTGAYDFQCALYDAAADGAQVGATVTVAGAAVANGLFTLTLDFGAPPFAGADRWLAIAVRAAGGGSYTPLAPRQPLTPTPYALFANAVNWDDILNRPAAFGVYTAGAGLTLTGQQFAIAGNGVTAGMLAADAGSLAKVTNYGMAMNGTSVGIGTTTAGFPLTFADTYGDKIAIWGQSGASCGFGNQERLLQIHTDHELADIAFGYGSSAAFTETVRIKGTGAVGIGTATPAARLEVNGTLKTAGFQLGSSATAGQVLTADDAGNGTWQIPVAYTAGSGLSLTDTQFSASFGTTASTVARGDHAHDATYWKQGGNAFGAVGVLGTTDNYALELRVNGVRALRLEPTASCPNVIMGSPQNAITSGYSSTISGGGGIDAGQGNIIGSYYSTIAGGSNNVVNADSSAIGGGNQNRVNTGATYSTIGGGLYNVVSNMGGAIAGGVSNTISGYSGSIGGGESNTVNGTYGTVPGGLRNTAGSYSFAAGFRAKATHTGSFVWGDFQVEDVMSPMTNTFSVRAQSGIWLGTTSSPSIPFGRFLNTSTGGYLSTDGMWTNSCDRNLKTAFAAIDGGGLLQALAALPITEWRYKVSAGVRHVGPTAQDFRAAFGLGLDDVSISTVDGIGVALAAAQALQRELAGVKADNARMQAENADLRGRLEKLEAAMARISETR